MFASSLLDAPQWLLTLVEAASRVTFVLFLAGAAALFFNRAAANVRHFIWQLAIVAVLLVPLATVVLPRLEVKVLPASENVPSVAPIDLPARPIPSRSQWADWGSGSSSSSSSRFERPVPAGWTRAPIADASLPSPTETTAWLSIPKLRVDQWLLLVWLAGVLAVLEWTLVDRIRVFFLSQRSRDVFDSRRDVFRQQLVRLGVTGNVRLVEADIELPMTWGVIDPVVAVPMSSVDWPEERLEAVLLHELAHVRRRDTLTQFLAQLACAAYWFHPMVWFAARQLRVLREYACDDEVITHGVRPSSYAEELLQLIQNVKRRDSLSGATLGMARRSQFKERLLSMLDPAVRRARLPKQRAISMALIAVAFTSLLVVVTPAAAEPLPRISPKEAAKRQVNLLPDPLPAPAPAPMPMPASGPRLPRMSAPMAPEAPEAPEAAEAPPCDEDQEDGEAEVRAKIDAALKTSKDDASLGLALKRIAHNEELNEESTRQAYLSAMSRLKDDGARWLALEGLLVGAPISEQTGAGVMKEARRFTRDAERKAFLDRMHHIREDELVRGPFANDYLDIAAKLQSQEALSDALRTLLHPSLVAQPSVERALGMAASLDSDLLAPVLIEVTDHQQLMGNVPALYGSLMGKLDANAQNEAKRRWDEAVADGSGRGGFWTKFAFKTPGDREAMREAQREYQRAMREQARDLAQQARDEAQARRDQAQAAKIRHAPRANRPASSCRLSSRRSVKPKRNSVRPSASTRSSSSSSSATRSASSCVPSS
ncbi:MAG: M56 family metallopeptidase [Archangium sp.]